MEADVRDLLGLSGDTRAVILCSDALGFSHANNQGVYEALRNGALNSARVMTPGPWVRHAATSHQGEDVGISLTLTCDNDIFHLFPLSASPSLVDGGGGFPATSDDLWSHADIDELRREARGQLERAIYWGFDISHIASFGDSLIGRPEFFDIVLDLAIEYRLPIRLPENSSEERLGYPAKTLVTQEGLVAIDQTIDIAKVNLAQYPTFEVAFDDVVKHLEPGVSEITFKLTADTPEIRELSPRWLDEVNWTKVVMDRAFVQRTLARYSVISTDYRRIRNLARQRFSRSTFLV